MNNTYPGRVIVQGVDPSGRFMVQAYCIMGRSKGSRNRVLSRDGTRIFTEAANVAELSQPVDPHIFYTAMEERGTDHVVSNGDQTDTVISSDASMSTALAGWRFEDDLPNETSRITGMCCLGDRHRFKFSILRKSVWDDSCDRHHFNYESIAPGFGLCIHTYSGDGNPLPRFFGEPFPIRIQGDSEAATADYFWSLFDRENRVALAVKTILISEGSSVVSIRNRFVKVVP